MTVWPEEQKRPLTGGSTGGSTALAAAWGATLPGGAVPRGLAGGGSIAGRQETGRVIPLPTSLAGGTTPGRGLDAYRAAPVTWAYQPPMPVPPVPTPSGGGPSLPRPLVAINAPAGGPSTPAGAQQPASRPAFFFMRR
mgnify:CR=1 FL=1